MNVRDYRWHTAALVPILAIALVVDVCGQPPRRPDAFSKGQWPRGILTHVPSTAGGREGIAVRIVPPRKARYEAGAPVAISVAGGHSAGNATSRMNVPACGFVEVSFAFPGGGRGDAKSDGTYDYRGPKCIQALRDVILFAMGKIADNEGREMQDLAGDVRVLTSNVGLHGGSHGGNACGAVMGLHGKDFPELAWKRLLDAPHRVAAIGSDQQGYNIIAGKDADGRHVRVAAARVDPAATILSSS